MKVLYFAASVSVPKRSERSILGVHRKQLVALKLDAAVEISADLGYSSDSSVSHLTGPSLHRTASARSNNTSERAVRQE